MSEEVTNKAQKGNDEEIDLIALARTLWEGRRTVIRTVIIFLVLGLLIAIFSPKEYTATTTMVPQINGSSAKMGGLSSLASLAGFNLDMNMGGNEISPMLYPRIVSSISYQIEIMNSDYKFDDLETEVNLYDYYTEHYKPGLFDILKKYTIQLPGLIINSLKRGDNSRKIVNDTTVISVTQEQYKVLKKIQNQLYLTVNEKEGYLTLNAIFHQPELSAQIAHKGLLLLQEYIIEFKIEKAKAQFEFIEDRYSETKKEFENAQEKLALYRDANRNINSAVAQTEEEQLQNEYRIAFEVYSEMAKQLEQARIKLKEDTPAFAVIEKVVVPVEKSKPKRLLILILWTTLGICFGIALSFSKQFILNAKQKWNSEF